MAKKRQKEKINENHIFFSPFRPGVLRVRDEGSSMLLKIPRNVIFGRSKGLFLE